MNNTKSPEELIAQFEAKNKNFAIAYGGDGTVLDVIKKTNGKKAIIPVRNYGLCEEHKNILAEILDKDSDRVLKQTLCPFRPR